MTALTVSLCHAKITPAALHCSDFGDRDAKLSKSLHAGRILDRAVFGARSPTDRCEPDNRVRWHQVEQNLLAA